MNVALDSLFLSHTDPMWIYDVATLRFLAVNKAAIARYGYSADEFLSMTIADIRPDEDHAALMRAVANIQADGRTESGPWRHRLKSGEIVFVDIVGNTIDYEGHRAELVTARDVTRLVLAERAAQDALAREKSARKASEALARQLQTMFDSVPGAFVVCLPDTLDVMAVSDAFLDLVAVPRVDCIGRNLFEILPRSIDGDVVTRLQSAFDRVIASKETDLLDLQTFRLAIAATPDDTRLQHFSLSVAPVTGPNHDLVYLMLRLQDVTAAIEPSASGPSSVERFGLIAYTTALKSDNLRLKDLASRLRTTQQLLNIGTWDYRLAEDRLDWSPNVYDFYGTTPEVFGHRFQDYTALIHPDDRADMLAHWQAFEQSGGTQFRFGHRICHPDGQIIHVHGVAERRETEQGPVLSGVVQNVTESVEGARALTQAKRLLEIAGTSAKFGAWRYDVPTATQEWSEQTARIHDEEPGFAPRVEDGLRYYAPEYRARITSLFQACLRDGTPYSETCEIISAKGRRLWVHATGEAERDQAGRIIAVQGSFQDISELSAARQRADELSASLAQTLESIGDAFFTLDQAGRFSYLNGRSELLLGQSREDLIGRPVSEEFPVLAAMLADLGQSGALDAGKTVRVEQYFPSLDRTFRAHAHPTPAGLAVYLTDITERVQSEEALRLSEARFRLITRATGNAVWEWNIQTGSHWWSDGLTAVFGHSTDVDDLGAIWQENTTPEDFDRSQATLERLIRGDADEVHDRYQFRRADGVWATVEDHAFAIRDDAGHVIRILGSMTDVSDRLKLEDRLRQSQKLEAVGQLTGGVAHDFNNLLTVIIGNTELLQSELDAHHPLRPFADMSLKAADRAAELTSRLLAFSRQQPLSPKVIDLNSAILNIEDILRRTLGENIKIDVIRAPDLWPAEIDTGQLESALLNLAINSRDAMTQGGCLTIETENVVLDETSVSTDPEMASGQYVAIVVSDTGEGIHPDQITRIFEPFFTTKPVGKGTGLGLSMVYGFVRQTGGHIRVYSERGEGTTFKLYFPRYAGSDTGLQSQPSAPTAQQGKETILVVEDDPGILQQLTGQLESLGYSVLTATSGEPALDLLSQPVSIDLLFTDVILPGGMNGRQIAEAARLTRPDLKVLYTSGYSENAVLHQGRLTPGIELLSKPYRKAELAARIRKVLDR